MNQQKQPAEPPKEAEPVAPKAIAVKSKGKVKQYDSNGRKVKSV